MPSTESTLLTFKKIFEALDEMDKLPGQSGLSKWTLCEMHTRHIHTHCTQTADNGIRVVGDGRWVGGHTDGQVAGWLDAWADGRTDRGQRDGRPPTAAELPRSGLPGEGAAPTSAASKPCALRVSSGPFARNPLSGPGPPLSLPLWGHRGCSLAEALGSLAPPRRAALTAAAGRSPSLRILLSKPRLSPVVCI